MNGMRIGLDFANVWTITWIVFMVIALFMAFFKNPYETIEKQIKGRAFSLILALFFGYLFCMYFFREHFEDTHSLSPYIEASMLFLSAILTFFAFWVQFKFNKAQTSDIKLERFENRFYNHLELLSQQETNCHIDGIGNGKQAFHFMFYEYKAIAVQVYKNGLFRDDQVGNGLTERELKVAFSLFLNGVSRSSTSRLKENSSDEDKIKLINNRLSDLQDDGVEQGIKYLMDYRDKHVKLFDGHRLRLVSYFRTVCMIIQYVVQSIKKDDLDGGLKDFYLRLFLAQLSEHQISMLYLVYLYDLNENKDFILDEYKEEVDLFFKETLPPFIKSTTMDPTHPAFVDCK